MTALTTQTAWFATVVASTMPTMTMTMITKFKTKVDNDDIGDDNDDDERDDADSVESEAREWMKSSHDKTFFFS